MLTAFRRFWFGEAVSGFGTAVTSLALQTLVVVTLSGSAAQVGLLKSATFLPYLVLGLVAGALVDRVRRRPVMIVTDLARAVLLVAIPVAWALGSLTFGLLLVVVLLFGTASLANDAASQSFVPRLVPRSDLQRAHARLDGAAAVAETAGPAVAGALVRLVGAPLAVLVDALTYLVSAATVASIRTVAEPTAAPRSHLRLRSLMSEMAEGVRWVYGRSGLARLAVATHVWFAGQAVQLVVVAPFAFLRLRLTALELGLGYALGGVGALLGTLVTTRVGRRLGTGGAIIAAHVVNAVGVLVVAAAALVPAGWPAAAVLGAGLLTYGWAMGVSNSHEMAYRQTLTPDGLQARTNTTMRSLNRAVLVVVSPVAGVLADRVGFAPMLGVAAGVFAVSATLLIASPFRSARV